MVRVDLPREFPGGTRFGVEEEEAVLRVVRARSPFRYYGEACGFEVAALEDQFARHLATGPDGVERDAGGLRVTAMNSGTGALDVALEALGVGAGDEVAVPGFFWISTIGSVVRNRAVPVLVDSDDTLNLDPDDLAAKITDRTKVVLPVHMAGEPARIGRLMEVVRAINRDRASRSVPVLRVLEDCAQAIGGWGHGVPGTVEPLAPAGRHRLGTFGDAAIFSLQLNKNITCGEGGLVVVRDPDLHRRVTALHDVGFLRDASGTGNVEDLAGQVALWGQGRRMTELQGAVARVQLGRLDDIVAAMRRSHAVFEGHLAARGLAVRAHETPDGSGHTGGFVCFRLPDAGGDAERLARGRAVAADLRAGGLLAVFLHDFEVHIYYNVPQLVGRHDLSGGCPWDCPRAAPGARDRRYDRGTLPRLDDAFATSILFWVPSLLDPNLEAAVCGLLDDVLDRIPPG
jgi:8-amino-3,8-dideoxy-alpha-D-manno-octulosonate transaminase